MRTRQRTAKLATFVLLMSTTTAALGAATSFAALMAVDDTFSVVGTSITLRPLENDYDSSGPRSLGVANTSGSSTAGGSYNCTTASASCQYNPPAGYYGADSFAYSMGIRSSNGPTRPVTGATVSATVHITVNPNGPPTAVDDNVVMKGSVETVFELLIANDTDPNLSDVGEELQIVRTSSTSTEGGAVECAEYWKLECRYTPPSGFVGVDEFSYTMTDNFGLTDTGSVAVTVNPNPNPVAVDDVATVAASYAGDRPHFELDLSSNDSDPEGDPVYVFYWAESTIGTQGGQLTLSTYTPAVGFFGTESIEYTAIDPFGGSDTATVTITVLQDLPPIANDDSAQVRGAVDVVIPVTANDTDDYDSFLWIGSFDQTSVSGGTVTCDGGSTCTYRAPDGFSGTDTFTYRVADHWGQLGNIATVTIDVLPNAAPVVGTTATVHLHYPEKTFGVLTGLTMSDADGDVLTAVGGTSTRGVTVSCGSGGTSLSGVYAPNCVYYGVTDDSLADDSILLTVSDGRGGTTTQQVDLTLVLDSPIQAPDVGASTAIDTPVRVPIVPVDDEFPGYNPGSGYDSETTAAGGPISCGSGPSATVAPGASAYWCDYTPLAGFEGIDTFTFNLNDAWTSATGVATVSVSAGAAVSEPAPAGGTVTSDVDGDGATPSDPIEASVQLGGNPGVVAIAERSTTTAPPTGYNLLGLEMEVSAPDQTAASPLKLTFVIDASAVPLGTDVATLKLIRNGVPLESCTGPAGTAAPDPCQQSATVIAGGDIQLVALSSHASVWSVGAPLGPTVSLSAQPSVAEGSSIQITPTASGTGTLHYAWTPAARFDVPTSASPHFTGLDDGVVTVGVTVTDDNGSASTSATVNVTNVAPTVAVVAPTTGSIGQAISVSGSFTDPGAADTHTATITWGDGATSAATVSGHTVAATSHSYAAAGSFTITLKVTDDDAGFSTATSAIAVRTGAITVSTSDAQANEGTSGGSAGTLTFTVKLDRADATTAHAIKYKTVNGSALKSSDYTDKSGTLTFKKGETIKTVTVKTTPDNVDETNETMSLQLSLTGSGLDPTAAHDLIGIGTIVDDDQATLSTKNVTQSEANNGTTNVQVTLKMTPSATPVTVTYATVAGTATAGSDFVVLNGSVTFQPGQTNKTVTVQIVNDRVREPSESFGLKFTGSAGVAGTPTATITIRDND
ncbi:MAG: Ig-like domain-containing protein [Ilumatobacteraceae bacterium]